MAKPGHGSPGITCRTVLTDSRAVRKDALLLSNDAEVVKPDPMVRVLRRTGGDEAEASAFRLWIDRAVKEVQELIVGGRANLEVRVGPARDDSQRPGILGCGGAVDRVVRRISPSPPGWPLNMYLPGANTSLSIPLVLLAHRDRGDPDGFAGQGAGVEGDLDQILGRSGAGHSTRVRTEAASRKAGDAAADDLAIQRKQQDLGRRFGLTEILVPAGLARREHQSVGRR